MQPYIAFLRGVNVGGNSIIKMVDLKAALLEAGLPNTRTYIQSGNVLFESAASADKKKHAELIQQVIKKHFGLDVAVAIFSCKEWQKIITDAPEWWGKDPDWKHNMLIMIEPYDMTEIVQQIGTLKPDIEAMQPGKGVIYQSMSRAMFGRTTTGKLASSPAYKKMTVRNYNTATKLLGLMAKA